MKKTYMTDDDDFYVGYFPSAPRRTAAFIKRIVITLAFAVVVMCCMVVVSQRKFSQGIFEYGTLAEVSGIVSLRPVPHILVGDGPASGALLLVGFGKMGAAQTIERIENLTGQPVIDHYVTLRGTRIYDKGKGLLQITAADNLNVKSEPASAPVPALLFQGIISVTGEIVDPKCYFGVMKPGEGKPHRSCAIRCISGGIPPVIATRGDRTEYFILTGSDIGKSLLPFVGEPVTLNGSAAEYGGWKVLHVEKESIRSVVKSKTSIDLLTADKLITQCSQEPTK
ncbi:MAG TPA: hypothetical protein VIH22_02115 [Cyclobacteriaceae bacterium]